MGIVRATAVDPLQSFASPICTPRSSHSKTRTLEDYFDQSMLSMTASSFAPESRQG